MQIRSLAGGVVASIAVLTFPSGAWAQAPSDTLAPVAAEPQVPDAAPVPAAPADPPVAAIPHAELQATVADTPAHWYEKIKIRGYTQLRYNRLYASEDKLKFDADKSVGADNGFLLRRARLIVQGSPFEILSIYLQPDFAGSISSGDINVASMRDWYADIFLDPSTKMFRFRAGQSKLPYGWENMQSSSNRLNLDRSDGINSAWPGERDLGIFFYAETPHVRKLYQKLVDSGLKGSGDYGILGFGVANGQTLNKAERNENRHLFARLNYPFEIGNQILEVGVQAYTGQVSLTKDDTVTGPDRSVDRRVGGNIVLYPKPIGAQLEYNVGEGPERIGKTLVANRPLDGGYVLLNARIGDFFPFVRLARYEGGRKEQLNTPSQKIHEIEGGVEATFLKAVELTAAVNYSGRKTNEVMREGAVVRLQLQFNY